MLEGVTELSLDFLNETTQAWAEIEYNRRPHREISCSPVERFAQAPDVLRESPASNALRDAFRREVKRRQRKSDGTLSLEGVRLEIPGRFRHFHDVSVRYASWDLSHIDLVDHRDGTVLAPIYPLDRRANADGQRLLFPPGMSPQPAEGGQQSEGRRPQEEIPPLSEATLGRLLRDRTAAGVPPEEPPSPRWPRRSIMNAKKLLSLWGLKWNPFSPELPAEGLLTTARMENFAQRVEQLVQEGGFAMISGEPGTGKSVALRILAGRLATIRDVAVGVLQRPQSRPARLLPRVGRHLLGETQPVEPLGRIQGPPRPLADARLPPRGSNRCC